MGDANLRADNALHDGDRVGKGEPPEHRVDYILHPNWYLAVRHIIFLYVQRSKLICLLLDIIMVD